MPRHNRRRDVEPLSASNASAARREEWQGEDYLVRTVPGSNAVKDYRCPGCDQLIRTGTPHLVAWPDEVGDAGDRRHWHTACWAARDRRRPR